MRFVGLRGWDTWQDTLGFARIGLEGGFGGRWRVIHFGKENGAEIVIVIVVPVLRGVHSEKSGSLRLLWLFRSNIKF